MVNGLDISKSQRDRLGGGWLENNDLIQNLLHGSDNWLFYIHHFDFNDRMIFLTQHQSLNKCRFIHVLKKAIFLQQQ